MRKWCALLVGVTIVVGCGGGSGAGGSGTSAVIPAASAPAATSSAASSPTPTSHTPTPSPSGTPAPTATPSQTAGPLPTATPLSVPAWNGKTLSTDYAVPVVNGQSGAFTPPYGDTPSGGQGPLGSTADGGKQTCAATMPNNYHVHVFIGIYVNGTELALPEGIGIIGEATPPPAEIIYATCFYYTHTHDQTGVFHIEYTNPNNTLITQPVFSVGDLFSIWGITVNAMQFGQFAGPVTVYTSGQIYRGGGNCSGNSPPAGTALGNGTTLESTLSLWAADPNAIPLYAHEVIWFFVGTGNPTSLPNVSFDEEC